MREHSINNLNNFIGGWYLDDTSVCDKLIEYHKNSNHKYEGTVTDIVDKESKDSIDVFLEDELLATEYCLNNLQHVVDLYRKKYRYCDMSAKWNIVEGVNLQHYKPNGGFYSWHTERAAGVHPFSSRHLAYMTYLNDVTDDGETEWYYQDVKIKPEKGLTIIWGVDWTFTHRGIPSPTQEKYIATGWYSFI
jgi:2OG-Fe(II) oxygenase superfamily